MKTMWEALMLCIPLTFMTFAVFVRSDMVTKTGWAQVADTFLVAAASWGLACAIFGRLAAHRGASFMLRASLALLSLWVMFHPDAKAAWVGAVVLVPATFFAVVRHKRIAPPKEEPAPGTPLEGAAATASQR